MTIPGREASDQQIEDGSAQLKENAGCARLFCTTLADINAIGEQQMKGLLNLAVTAAEVANSLYSSQASTGGASAASNEEFAELASQIKSTADKIGQAGEAAGDAGPGATPGADTLCKSVEQNINLAMENGVAHQQALNELGQSILAQSVELLFSVASANLNAARQNR